MEFKLPCAGRFMLPEIKDKEGCRYEQMSKLLLMYRFYYRPVASNKYVPTDQQPLISLWPMTW